MCFQYLLQIVPHEFSYLYTCDESKISPIVLISKLWPCNVLNCKQTCSTCITSNLGSSTISPHFSNLIICIYTTPKQNHCYLCKCCVHVEVGTICCHVQTLKSLHNTKYDVISKLQTYNFMEGSLKVVYFTFGSCKTFFKN